MRVIPSVFLILAIALAGKPSEAAETYRSAVVDSAGRLAIQTTDGRRIIVRKAKDQTTFANPVISPDRTAVGAQAEFPNCCTSYDIPLELVIYSAGQVHRLTGIGLPIFQWRFEDQGSRVAYSQETVHFSCETHYELRDVRTRRLIDSADVPEECRGEKPDLTSIRIPSWVSKFRSAKEDVPARSLPRSSPSSP
jgi:hypothetical protein